MTDKEKRYHLLNIIIISVAILVGILLIRMGHMADANQLSMSAPGMQIFSLLLMGITGGGVIWVAVSALINKHIRGMVTKGVSGVFKSFVGIILFFVVLIASSLLLFPWMIVFATLAVYLYLTSFKALITKDSEMIANQ